jgi:hypothetical protein
MHYIGTRAPTGAPHELSEGDEKQAERKQQRLELGLALQEQSLEPELHPTRKRSDRIRRRMIDHERYRNVDIQNNN